MVYLLGQAFYFGVETGIGWIQRLIGAVVLGIAAVAAYWPSYVVVLALVVICLALAIHLTSRHETPHETPADLAD